MVRWKTFEARWPPGKWRRCFAWTPVAFNGEWRWLVFYEKAWIGGRSFYGVWFGGHWLAREPGSADQGELDTFL